MKSHIHRVNTSRVSASAIGRSLAVGLLVAAPIATYISGCGGSAAQSGANAADGSATKNARGSAKFTVAWPNQATSVNRLIPNDATSIRVSLIASDGSVAATQLLARPSGGGTSTVATFSSLLVGSYTAVANAYPSADGSGVIQATGQVPLAITANQVTLFSLTMASTIDHLTVTPADQTITAGATEQLMATAYDATGAVVLLSPFEINWSIAPSMASIAGVDSGTGLVTAGAVSGTVTVTAVDTETASAGVVGKTGSTTVTVVPAPTPTPTPTPSPTPTPTPTGGFIGTIQ